MGGMTMRPIMLPLAMGLAVVLLTGCATQPAQQYVPVPDLTRAFDLPDRARIYILNKYDLATIWENGRQIGSLPAAQMKGVPERFVCWERQPGRAVIVADCAQYMQTATVQCSIAVNAQAGKTYFLVIEPVTPVKPALRSVSEQEWRRRAKGNMPPEYIPDIGGTQEGSPPGSAPEVEAVPKTEPTPSDDRY
jgi:hypothetical protein